MLSADHSLSDKVKIVVETYGLTQPHHHAQNTADMVLLFLVSKDLQFDLIAGSIIMHAYAEKFVELGLSFRV